VVPQALTTQFAGIITNTEGIVDQIKTSIDEQSATRISTRIRWVISGREDIERLRSSLEQHKSALNLAVDCLALYVSTHYLLHIRRYLRLLGVTRPLFDPVLPLYDSRTFLVFLLKSPDFEQASSRIQTFSCRGTWQMCQSTQNPSLAKVPSLAKIQALEMPRTLTTTWLWLTIISRTENSHHGHGRNLVHAASTITQSQSVVAPLQFLWELGIRQSSRLR
jgi:hypothetical protein